jgi:hypothetical protein
MVNTLIQHEDQILGSWQEADLHGEFRETDRDMTLDTQEPGDGLFQ